MNNNEAYLNDRIITSKSGKKFIFPFWPVKAVEDVKERIVFWTEKAGLAKVNSNEEGLKKAKEMLELLLAGNISLGADQCQSYYMGKGLTNGPTRSQEERSEASANRRR